MEEDLIINTEVKNADRSEKQLEDLADATNKAEDAGKDYEGTLGNMGGELEIFGVSLNGLNGGFKDSVGAIGKSVKSLKSFKIALASTGVGLLVLALGSLVVWMQNSQEGMNFMNDALAVVGATIQQVIGVITQLGGALVKVFQGDFAGAMEDASSSLDGFIDGIISAVNATLALEKQLRNISTLQGKSTVLIAANNAEIAKNKRVIEDTTKSTLTRIRAAERNADLIKENQKFQEDLAFMELEAERERVRIDNAQFGRNETLLSDQLILRDLEAQVIEKQTEGNEKIIEFEVKLNELYAVRNEELAQIALINSTIGAEVEKVGLQTISTQFDIEANQKSSLANMTKQTDEYYANIKKKEEEDLKLKEENARIEMQMTADLFGALAGLAGQDSILGKALAIAQTTINTSQAITTALLAPTMTQRILGVAFATATGLKAINDIKGVPLPQVVVNTSTPFGRGGMIFGDSHSMASGGVNILAEGGEAVINKRSTAMFKPLLSRINLAGGGVPIMADGGLVGNPTGSRFINLERALQNSRPVLVTSDLRTVEQGETSVKIATTL